MKAGHWLPTNKQFSTDNQPARATRQDSVKFQVLEFNGDTETLRKIVRLLKSHKFRQGSYRTQTIIRRSSGEIRTVVKNSNGRIPNFGFAVTWREPKREPSRPPSSAEFLLYLCLGSSDRETIPGDLLEEYRETILPKFGPRRAHLWYWVQVLRSAMPLIGSRLARAVKWSLVVRVANQVYRRFVA